MAPFCLLAGGGFQVILTLLESKACPCIFWGGAVGTVIAHDRGRKEGGGMVVEKRQENMLQ